MSQGNDNQLLNVLVYEHGVRMQEAMFHAKRYHNQVTYLQVIIIIILAMVSTLFSKLNITSLLNTGLQSYPDKILAIIMPIAFITIPGILFFVISNFMDALYNMNCHYAGLKYIENRINKLVGTDALKWERSASPFIYSKKLFMGGISVKPLYLVGFWAFVTFLSIMTPIVYLSFWIFGGVFLWIYIGSVVLLSVYHLVVWAHTALKWKQQVLDVLENT